MIYTVTLNPAVDCAMDAGALALGRVNRASSQSIRFGGKGINVSYVLKELGAPSVLTGFTAGCTGALLTDGLTSEGFICDFVRLSQGMTRINVKLTLSGTAGDPDTEINAPGPAPSADELQLLTDKLSRLTPGDALVIAGSLPAGTSADYVITLGKAVPDGVSLICDLSGESLRASLALSPDLVKPNVHELYSLLGIPATDENFADRGLLTESAAHLISMGAKNVLVTMGEGGAYFVTVHGQSGYVPSPPMPASAKEVRSAVGCGDSTVAGYLMGMGYAGADVRDGALCAAGIPEGTDAAEAAAKLAVALGSASYYFGFPASPHKLRLMTDT